MFNPTPGEQVPRKKPWPNGKPALPKDYGSTTKPMKTSAVWANVKAAYLLNQGSCRQLAERYGLTPTAVQNRCKREGWRKEALAAEANLARHVDQKLAEKAETIAERAGRFVERCAQETDDWLDTVQRAKKLLDAGDLEGLKTLVNAWRVPVEVGRKTYRLDEEAPPTQVQIAVYNKTGYTKVQPARPEPMIDLPPAEQDG
jgi:transposase